MFPQFTPEGKGEKHFLVVCAVTTVHGVGIRYLLLRIYTVAKRAGHAKGNRFGFAEIFDILTLFFVRFYALINDCEISGSPKAACTGSLYNAKGPHLNIKGIVLGYCAIRQPNMALIEDGTLANDPFSSFS